MCHCTLPVCFSARPCCRTLFNRRFGVHYAKTILPLRL
jgi:hypothetical protein